MEVHLKPKEIRRLHPTDIVFQTGYWGNVKNRLGWKPYAFDLGEWFPGEDVLVLVRSFPDDMSVAYVPQGPELAPDEEDQGIFLEALSESLAEKLGSGISFVRYDLPWRSPYGANENIAAFSPNRTSVLEDGTGTSHWIGKSFIASRYSFSMSTRLKS